MTAPAQPSPNSPQCREAQLWAEWQLLTDRLTPLLMTPKACPNFIDELSECTATLMELVRNDNDLAIFHLVNSKPDKVYLYGVHHVINTATLICLIGRRKDWNESYSAGAIKAALTMNLSITALQNELAQQGSPLSPEQRILIDNHPDESVKLLQELGVDDEYWLRAVAQHHERPDGKGYPRRLTEVSQWADAVRTCDVFSAKISPRISRTGMLSPHAAEAIFRQRSSGYFGATIIRELGLYPPGCLVRLSSGEGAIVLRRTSSPMRPEVALITDVQGALLDKPVRSATGQEQKRTVLGASGEEALIARFSAIELYSQS